MIEIVINWEKGKVLIGAENGTGAEYYAKTAEDVGKAVIRYLEEYTSDGRQNQPGTDGEDKAKADENMVEATVYANPFLTQKGTVRVPRAIIDDPGKLAKHVRSRFWDIEFKEDDLDYAGTVFDIEVDGDHAVYGESIPGDDEDEEDGDDEY